ncbi:MAG: NAD(P)-binding protein [Bacteroidales bacterium]|nr:NAD(P)-binding protein [Bacteroidales bacterium]
MKTLAIIGSGISGLAVANLLNKKYDIEIFEKESTPGGLIRCKTINDNLFHICGGHVFNTKREDVMNFFSEKFDFENDFIKSERNSCVFFENGEVTNPVKRSLFVKNTSWVEGVPYPIENHVHMLKPEIQHSFINDIEKITKSRHRREPKNFEEFLKWNFGETLYKIYFKPYNEKIWHTNLKKIPLSWLKGKLPMPSIEEILYNNFNHIKDKTFVHSNFWYPKKNGSQFIANKLAENQNINFNSEIKEIKKINNKWIINNKKFDIVFFCGNIKDLNNILQIEEFEKYKNFINNLEYHGTTTVFCEIDKNSYSWIYLPSTNYQSHRIICTGNFSPENNNTKQLTATIEFTDQISEEEILQNLSKMPLHPRYLTHEYHKYTYPIQNNDTREKIKEIKEELSQQQFYMSGRFVDWEYYNMDIAVGAVKDTIEKNKL